MRRSICLILTMAFLICICSAGAASAGSASDPLISQSYITDNYVPAVQQQGAALRAEGEAAVKNYLSARLSAGGDDVNLLNGYKSLRAAKGDSFVLPFGSSLILLSGSGSVSHNGTVLDTAAGAELPSGQALQLHVRYLVAEDTSAAFTISAASASLLIEGSYSGKGTEIVTFSDVPESHFAYAAIGYFAGKGLVSGLGDGRFDPSGVMTRGMFVTLLGRVAGVDKSAYPGSSFSDVAVSQYYAPYVQWASQAGLVSGMGDGTFAPDVPITRQQMAKLVVAFAGYGGYSLKSGTAATFADDGQIASWAKQEVYQAAAAGLINGRGGNRFEPGATANRAEVCTLVYRLITA